jgi:hypothetical protein
MLPSFKKPDIAVKSGWWCWVALVMIIIGAAAIRCRLLSVPLERDEGEYAYIAQQMLKGVAPYESAYSMKLPGIYAVYAIFLAIFGQTITAIHLGLLVFNAATIFVIFWLTNRLFGGLAAVMAAAAYAITSLTRSVLGFSANAEHFVVLPAIIGVLLIVKLPERRRLLIVFFAAIFLGLAFVIKQHGIFFSFFGAAYLLYSDLRRRPIEWKGVVCAQLVFIAGAVAPFAVVCLFYWHVGVFDKFWFWTFTYSIKYISTVPLEAAKELFAINFVPAVAESVSIWVLALLGLLRFLFSSKLRTYAVFALGFLVFSFFSVCPGFYFRGHYITLLLPALAVLAGVGFTGLVGLLSGRVGRAEWGVAVSVIALIILAIPIFGQRKYFFYLTPADVCREIYFGNPFTESLEIAEYIERNSSPEDTVAILGSEPQICFYSGRRSATRYIYTYPLMDRNEYTITLQKEMIQEIDSARPKFMVFVSVQSSWIQREESILNILEWAWLYSESFYETAGVIEIRPDGRSFSRWNAQAANYTPVSDVWVAVFRRKQ